MTIEYRDHYFGDPDAKASFGGFGPACWKACARPSEVPWELSRST